MAEPNEPRVRPVVGAPTRLMWWTWTLLALLYFAGPMEPVVRVSGSTWAFIALCLVIFQIGGAVARAGLRDRTVPRSLAIDANRLDRLVRAFAIVGLIGGLCIAVDKLALSGINFASGFTSVRFQTSSADVISPSYGRSPLLFLGTLTYCFSLLSLPLYLLAAERLRRHTLTICLASMLSPLIVAAVYGGRLSILAAPGLALGAVLIRRARGWPAIPIRSGVVPAVALLVVTGAIYNGKVLASRRAVEGNTSYEMELDFTARYRGFRIRPWAEEAFRSMPISEARVLDIVNFDDYFIGGLPSLEVILHHGGGLGPYYGQYEVVSLTTFFQRWAPEYDKANRMHDELLPAKLLGAFVTAWGTVLLDFGLPGVLVFAYLLGFLSTTAWHRATRDGDLALGLVSCVCAAFIMFSPIHSLFGAGPGVFLVVDLVVAFALLRRAAGQRPHSWASGAVGTARPVVIGAAGG